MVDDEDFWDDLLTHIHQRVLVPITGPELNIVTTGETNQPLTAVIAQRLVEKYELKTELPRMTMGAAAAAALRKNRDHAHRLHVVIHRIIAEYEEQPCVPLRALASITDLRLFVSTTPDRLLARAVNDTRSGERKALELTFSPTLSTSELAERDRAPEPGQTVVIKLFGQSASTAEYAVDDEDLLEWVHALISGTASLPEYVTDALRKWPLLFVGCEIPDWMGRFLLRLASRARLSQSFEHPFFLVHSPGSLDPLLAEFLATYCPQVRPLEMAPAEFAVELHRRWTEQLPPPPPNGTPDPYRNPTPNPKCKIFVSYCSEDRAYAKHLAETITELGGSPWWDREDLDPGDVFDIEIHRSINQTCHLFVPLISANTERRYEGYVFQEWLVAIERRKRIMGRRFIIPIVIDDPPQKPTKYRLTPIEFGELTWGYAPKGVPDDALRQLLRDEIEETDGKGPDDQGPDNP